MFISKPQKNWKFKYTNNNIYIQTNYILDLFFEGEIFFTEVYYVAYSIVMSEPAEYYDLKIKTDSLQKNGNDYHNILHCLTIIKRSIIIWMTNSIQGEKIFFYLFFSLGFYCCYVQWFRN